MAKDTIHINVDPRIEFMNMIQYFCGEDKRLGDILVKEPSEYRTALLDHFDVYRSHQVFSTYTDMARQGFSYDAPHYFILSLSLPEFELIHPITSDIENRSGGSTNIEHLRSSLRDLYIKSSFEDFFLSWGKKYEALMNPVKKHLRNTNLTTRINSYFQEYHRQYDLILSPLIIGGYSLPLSDGHVVSLLGMNWAQDNPDDYSRLDEYLLHEWCHSFINPVSLAHQDLVDNNSGLFDPISEVMKSYAYVDWSICLNEHIVRAVTVRLHEKLGNTAYSERMKKEHYDMGFIYINQLINALNIYENAQSEYPSFSSYFPVLIDSLVD